MFHVSDNIFWGSAVRLARPFGTLDLFAFLCRYGGESLVLATSVPEKNLPLLWPPSLHWKRKTIIIMQQPNGRRQWGFRMGG